MNWMANVSSLRGFTPMLFCCACFDFGDHCIISDGTWGKNRGGRCELLLLEGHRI